MHKRWLSLRAKGRHRHLHYKFSLSLHSVHTVHLLPAFHPCSRRVPKLGALCFRQRVSTSLNAVREYRCKSGRLAVRGKLLNHVDRTRVLETRVDFRSFRSTSHCSLDRPQCTLTLGVINSGPRSWFCEFYPIRKLEMFKFVEIKFATFLFSSFLFSFSYFDNFLNF